MNYIPETESGKKALILWTNEPPGTGRDIESGPGMINPANLTDMKRLYVYNEKTHLMERPFYDKNLEDEYDADTNPIPHKALLDKNFNLEFFEKNKVFVVRKGDTTPSRVVLLEKPEPPHYGTRSLNEEELQMAQGIIRQREQEVRYENELFLMETNLGKLKSTMNLYQKFYGPDRATSESKENKYRSIDEQILFNKLGEIKASNPSAAELGALTAEQFTLLTIAALYTKEGTKNNPESLQYNIGSSTMHLDTIMRGRAGYHLHQDNDNAYEAAKKASAALNQGNAEPYHKLLAEGLNNFSLATRAFTLHTPYLADQKHAFLPIAVGYADMLKNDPELLQSLKREGLKDETVQMINAQANAYRLERERLKKVHDLLTTSRIDVEGAKKKLTGFLTDTILLNMFSREMMRMEDETARQSLPQVMQATMNRDLTDKERNRQIGIANGQAMVTVPIRDLEKTFADPAKIKDLRKRIRTTPKLSRLVTDITDRMQTMTDIRDFLAGEGVSQLMTNTRECEKILKERQSEVFHSARKDLLTLAHQMDVLVSRNSRASTEFKALRDTIRDAVNFKNSGEELKNVLIHLKETAHDYMQAKDNDFYSRMNKKLFGREVKENRASDHGLERYKFARIAEKLCAKHLEEFEECAVPPTFEPRGNDESKTDRASVSMIKQLASQLRHVDFNKGEFSRYMVLKSLQDTGNSKSIANLTLYDLREQAKALAATEELKIMETVCAEQDLSMHEMVDCYKAAKKYVADFKKLESLQKADLEEMKNSMNAGKSEYLHSCGNADLDEAMKAYAIEKVDALIQKKHVQFEQEFNRYTRYDNDGERLNAEHRYCIPEKKDRAINVNEFDTSRVFFGTVALSLLIDDKPDMTTEQLSEMIDKIRTGRMDEDVSRAYTRAFNLIKYGIDADYKLTEPEIPLNASQLGKEKVGELAVRTVPRMAKVIQHIARQPGNDIAGSNFSNNDHQKIRYLACSVYNYSQELNKEYEDGTNILNHCVQKMYPENSAEKQAEITRCYEFSEIVGEIQEFTTSMKELRSGYENTEAAFSSLGDTMGKQLGRIVMKQRHAEELRNAVREDLLSPQNQERIAQLDLPIVQVNSLMITNCPLYNRLISVMTELSHDQNAVEKVMPYIADGSFAESLQPRENENGEIAIRVPANAEAIVKWAQKKRQDELKAYRKQVENKKSEYDKYAGKTSDERYKSVFTYGNASMKALYSEGLVPPVGVIAHGGEKSRMASGLIKNVLKAEFMKTQIDAHVDFAQAEQKFNQMMQNPMMKAMVQTPSMKEVRSITMEKGAEKLIRTCTPRENAQPQNQIELPQVNQGH